jgi:hypothetical protein
VAQAVVAEEEHIVEKRLVREQRIRNSTKKGEKAARKTVGKAVTELEHSQFLR